MLLSNEQFLTHYIMTEVLDKEIARRVKEILDISRPDWSGVPEPYHAENPPPQVKVQSPCFFDIYG